MTKGLNCTFDFYVIGLTTSQIYNETYYKKGLDLPQAIMHFKEAIKKYNNAVIALGVNYITERKDLNNMGCGGCDLVQLVDGKIKLSSDYKRSTILSGESLITINTINILKKEFENYI